MKKKQLITSFVCLALLILMFLGSSIAWFTDTEASVNVMVAGKIAIEQEEIFDTTTVLMPSMKVEKKVTVTNVGNQPCYVRTLFAFEDSEDGSVLEMITPVCPDGVTIVIPGVTPGTGTDKVQFKVIKDGKTTVFTLGYFVYNGQLPDTGDNSYVCLETVTLSSAAGNDWMEAIGDQYEIFVLSQATQTTGLGNDYEAALDTVFGAINSNNAAKWFAFVLNNDNRYTPGELEATVEEDSASIIIGTPVSP